MIGLCNRDKEAAPRIREMLTEDLQTDIADNTKMQNVAIVPNAAKSEC